MITTPQASSEPKTLVHSKSLGSMTTLLQNESSKPVASASNNITAPKLSETFKFQPQQLAPKPFIHPITTRLKTHSPNMSISSDGTLSTIERRRAEFGEETSLLLDHSRSHGRQGIPLTPTTAQAVSGHSMMMNMQTSYLQVNTPKSRPRGFSSPDPVSADPVSPASAVSTPTVATPTPGFSPSASIAPTPELTPQKSLPGLLDSLPMVKVDFVPPRKGSISSPVIVDGLQFPAPPEDTPLSKRRPTTMSTIATRSVSASPSRTSKSMRVPRSPGLNPVGDESPKGRVRKSELGRPRPLDLGVVPSYREWKNNVPEVQVQPGELTGLELDLNEGTSEPGRKRDSLMEQHQQLFLQGNPFQTPPSPAPSFPTSPLRSMPSLPPPAGGPPTMPLPPSPSVLSLSIPPTLSYSPISTPTLPEPRRSSLTPRRSRVDSSMIRSSMLFSSTPVSSPITSDPMTAVTSALSAQRAQFDGMSKYLVDVVKAFEDEKRAFEMRIQELSVAVAEKEAKAKEDERKIQGLEWLVGNLNLRAQSNNGKDHSDSGSSAVKAHRRRSSFSGLGLKDDMPITPLAMGHAADATERTKRTASMDDAFRNLIALSMPEDAVGHFPSLNPPNIYEWAANTVLEQD